MRHRAATTRVAAAGLAYVLTACGDPAGAAGPAAPPLFDRGGPPLPLDTPLSLNPEATLACGFPVLEAFTGRTKVLELPGDRTIVVFPGLKGTFVNGATGASVTFSSTGVVHERVLADGGLELVLTGRGPVGLVEDGVLRILLVSGRFTIVYGPGGSIVQPLSGVGARVDLCDALR